MSTHVCFNISTCNAHIAKEKLPTESTGEHINGAAKASSDQLPPEVSAASHRLNDC